VTTVEFEPGLVRDLNEFFQKIIPEGPAYHHHNTWGDDNGSSHVRAALLKPSLTIPFRGGELLLGTWQQVVVIDFDTRPRRRKVVLQLTGE
jgi:secondary thiamine-phosphate synthase enzyme